MVQLPKSASENKNGLWQILVVDNEASSAEQCATALKDAGYTLRAVTSARGALDRMRECPADLVLTEMTFDRVAHDGPLGAARAGTSSFADASEGAHDALTPPEGRSSAPVMDGMQLLANLKEMYPDTCVVVMTSAGTIGDAMEAMRRGAADFLPKPFDPRDLQRIVAACLTAAATRRFSAFLNDSSAMLELARSLSKTTDPHALSQQALDLARRNFDADSAILFSYEPVQAELSVAAHAGRSLTRRSHPDSLAEQCLEAIRRKTILLDADVPSGDCYAFLPLLVTDRPRGALCLRRLGGPAFHENSIGFMEMFATHLAVTLESARLYEVAAEQVSELEELVTVSRTLSLNADRERMCRLILDSAARLTAADICAVLVLTEKGDARLQTSPALRDGSPIFEAIQGKMAAALGLAAAEPGLKDADEPATLGRFAVEARRALVSFLSAPLTAQGAKPFGILAAFSSRPHAFSAEDARRLSALAEGASAAADNAETLVRVSNMYHETLEFFAAMVEARCPDAQGHSRQVRTYAGELARALNMTSKEVFVIEDAALLHDVGKICVPDALLSKAGPLTVEESEIMAAHAAIGAGMFSRTVHLCDLAPIVRHHHERFDGQGYPDGIEGEAIPLGARVVAVADVFDALVSHRVYRPAMDFAQARNMLAERSGSFFDPRLVSAFLGLSLEKMTEH